VKIRMSATSCLINFAILDAQVEIVSASGAA
jgi:hypothetical protein